MQALRQQNARVPRKIFGEGLLGFRANDRIELVLFLVPLHEAGAFERLSLDVLATFVRTLAGAEAVETHTSGEWLPAKWACLDLLEVEGRIFLELLIDDVLQLERAKLKDVVLRDLFWRDLELLLREESRSTSAILQQGDSASGIHVV